VRESCLDCVRKHIAQAIILLKESKLGHPNHFWLALGHLAEAEEESMKDHLNFAEYIRKERHKILKNPDAKDIYLEELIKTATKLDNKAEE
jgi:predicted phosphoribosyltransferase